MFRAHQNRSDSIFPVNYNTFNICCKLQYIYAMCANSLSLYIYWPHIHIRSCDNFLDMSFIYIYIYICIDGRIRIHSQGLIYPYIHVIVYSYTRIFNYSYTHVLIYSYTHILNIHILVYSSYTRILIHSYIPILIYSYTRILIYSYIHKLSHIFKYSYLIYSCAHVLI